MTCFASYAEKPESTKRHEIIGKPRWGGRGCECVRSVQVRMIIWNRVGWAEDPAKDLLNGGMTRQVGNRAEHVRERAIPSFPQFGDGDDVADGTVLSEYIGLSEFIYFAGRDDGMFLRNVEFRKESLLENFRGVRFPAPPVRSGPEREQSGGSYLPVTRSFSMASSSMLAAARRAPACTEFAPLLDAGSASDGQFDHRHPPG